MKNLTLRVFTWFGCDSDIDCDTGAWFLGLLDRDVGDSVLGNLSYLYIAIASL